MLFDLVLSIHVCLCVHASWSHLTTRWVGFWLLRTYMLRSWSLDRRGALRQRSSLSLRAGD